MEYFTQKLGALSDGYREIEAALKAMWNQHKSGIKSFGNKLENRFVIAQNRIAAIKADLAKTDVGVLYTDLMMPEGFGTVRAEIRVKYAGDAQETKIYRGNVKPSVVGFEAGGCYNFRYPLEDKKVEYVVYAAFGEGALYPTHFRYTRMGKKYVAGQVEILQGNVLNADAVLINDARFATMGYDDGLAHFNDLSLSKRMSEIKVFFKELV